MLAVVKTAGEGSGVLGRGPTPTPALRDRLQTKMRYLDIFLGLSAEVFNNWIYFWDRLQKKCDIWEYLWDCLQKNTTFKNMLGLSAKKCNICKY